MKLYHLDFAVISGHPALALYTVIYLFTFRIYIYWWTFVCGLFSFTASQAAARARGRTGEQSAAASSITGMSLQEAHQILNVSKLNPEEIEKVQNLKIKTPL